MNKTQHNNSGNLIKDDDGDEQKRSYNCDQTEYDCEFEDISFHDETNARLSQLSRETVNCERTDH
jgi:hypothetical protein